MTINIEVEFRREDNDKTLLENAYSECVPKPKKYLMLIEKEKTTYGEVANNVEKFEKKLSNQLDYDVRAQRIIFLEKDKVTGFDLFWPL